MQDFSTRRHLGSGAGRDCVWRAMEMPWDKSTEAYASQMASCGPLSSERGFRLQVTFLSPPIMWRLGTDPGPEVIKGS